MQQVASESLLGKDTSATRPLFQKAAILALEAIRLVREGGITIDPIVANEFVQQFRKLEKQYMTASESALDVSITTTLFPYAVAI